LLGQAVDKPKPGIVPGIGIVSPGVAEANYQAYVCFKCSHVRV
jgi:hypothetical protein